MLLLTGCAWKRTAVHGVTPYALHTHARSCIHGLLRLIPASTTQRMFSPRPALCTCAGGEAAQLVVALLDVVNTAIANRANLLELQRWAMALLDILEAYHPDLERRGTFKEVVDKFKDGLQVRGDGAGAQRRLKVVVPGA